MKVFKVLLILFQILAAELAFGCSEGNLCDDPGCAIQKRADLILKIVDGVHYYLLGGKSCYSIVGYDKQDHKLSEFNSSDWNLIKFDETLFKSHPVPIQKGTKDSLLQDSLARAQGKKVDK